MESLRVGDFTFTFHFHALAKEISTHSSILAWRIPGMEQPGGLPSMGSHRVRHNGSYLAGAAAFEFWINDSRIPTLKMRELRLLEFNYLAKRKTSCK